jgi:5'-nucleotidase
MAGHTVTAVAPDRERSGQSHSVNFFAYLQVTEVKMPDGSIGYSVNGTPADCSHLGCFALAKDPVDLVVSGINTDTNLGYDANYSGTVAAALEAVANGFPALAVSQERSPEPDWALAGKLTKEAVNLFHGWGIPTGVLVNMNIPAHVTDPAWIWVPLNLNAVREYYVVDVDSEGKKRYKRTRDEKYCVVDPGSDIDLSRQGRITLSPLGPVRSERDTLARLRSQTFETRRASGSGL